MLPRPRSRPRPCLRPRSCLHRRLRPRLRVLALARASAPALASAPAPASASATCAVFGGRERREGERGKGGGGRRREEKKREEGGREGRRGRRRRRRRRKFALHASRTAAAFAHAMVCEGGQDGGRVHLVHGGRGGQGVRIRTRIRICTRARICSRITRIVSARMDEKCNCGSKCARQTQSCCMLASA